MVLVAVLLGIIVIVATVDAMKNDEKATPKMHESPETFNSAQMSGVGLKRTPLNQGHYGSTQESNPLRSKTSKVGLSRYS